MTRGSIDGNSVASDDSENPTNPAPGSPPRVLQHNQRMSNALQSSPFSSRSSVGTARTSPRSVGSRQTAVTGTVGSRAVDTIGSRATVMMNQLVSSRSEFMGGSRGSNRSTPNLLEDAPVLPGLASDVGSGATGEGTGVYIWGTTISFVEATEVFRDFIRNFRIPRRSSRGHDETSSDDGSEEEDDMMHSGNSHFIDVLHQIYETEDYNINIDCQYLEMYADSTRKLRAQLVRYPQEMIPIMDLVIHEEFCRLHSEDALPNGRRIQVRTFNLGQVRQMRLLDPEDIDQLVAIRGMVIRTSSIIPDLKQAFFQCTKCMAEEEVIIDRGHIAEPERCAGCQAKRSMQVIHNRSLFADKQLIKLQESPENIPEGETPHTVMLYAYDDLVDVARPGDRVEVTGVLRATPVKTNPRTRNLHSIYKMHLDVIHFKKTRKGQVSAESPNANPDSEFHTQFTEGDQVSAARQLEKEAKFREMAQDPNLYENLAHSLAPSIWELDDVKKGILCQLFGGTNKETGDPQVSKSIHRMRARGEINVLLCGDPGTAKSQLLGYVKNIAPRGIYTSGKGSSAVGLTAYVTKDPDTKEYVLESGALVLSDRGICCIDEFDKMSDATRAILHECMEQQTISIAKAGVIATLNARTSILASANPIESRYNPKLSIVQNISLPPTLLSRFDLIYLVLDKPDVVQDRRLAKHLVSLYFVEPTAREATYSGSILADYISFARQNCHPQITNGAARALADGYVEMRKAGAIGGGRKTIAATPRQLESLIRISEALARMHLQEHVTEEHVGEAIRLVNVATQRAAMDPRTGTIDMDAITTGMGALERDNTELLASAVLERLQESFRDKTVSIQQLLKVMNEQSSVPVEQRELMQAIESLVEDDLIMFTPKTATVKLL